MDAIDLLSQFYPGWTLTELMNLSVRERINWLNKASSRPRTVK